MAMSPHNLLLIQINQHRPFASGDSSDPARPFATGGVSSDPAPLLARGSWVVRGESVTGHMALMEERSLQQDPLAEIQKYEISTDDLEAAAAAPDENKVAPDLGPLGSTLPNLMPQPAAKLEKRSWGPTTWAARNAAVAKV